MEPNQLGGATAPTIAAPAKAKTDLPNINITFKTDAQGQLVIDVDKLNGWEEIEDITLPESVIIIPTAAGNIFVEHFTNLRELIMPGVTTIGDEAFRGCASLQSIKCPVVTTLGNRAFEGCKELTEINSEKIESIGTHAFYECEKIYKLVVLLLNNVKD